MQMRADSSLQSSKLFASWNEISWSAAVVEDCFAHSRAPFNLQSAPAITSTFTNTPGTSSPYANQLTSPQQFFPARINLAG